MNNNKSKKKKDRSSDIYLWRNDNQKKFVGISKGPLKSGDIVGAENDRQYIVKASACGVAVVREVK